MSDYCKAYRDIYVGEMSPWFTSMVLISFIFHFPFFFFATYAFAMGNRPWIRYPALIYSVNVCTSVFSIIAQILYDDNSKRESIQTRYGQVLVPKTDDHRFWLLVIYIPYFIIPFILGLRMLFQPPKPVICEISEISGRRDCNVTQSRAEQVRSSPATATKKNK